MIGAAPWRPPVGRRIVEILSAFADAEDPAFRRRIVRHTEQYLHPAGLVVADQQVRRDHCAAIVNACAAHHDPAEALHAVVEACADLAPYDPQFVVLEKITRPYLPRAVPVSFMRRVEDVLTGMDDVSPAELRMLWVSTREPGNFFDVDDAAGLLEAVDLLNRQRRSEAVPVPGLSILRLLAATAELLRRQKRDDDAAELDDLVATGHRELRLAPTPKSAHRPRHCDLVQIRIDELGVPGGRAPRFTITASFFRREAEGLVCQESFSSGDNCRAAEIHLRGSELLGTIGAFVPGPDFRVEFLLPYSLLSLPTQLWTVAGQSRLEHHCRVVVRSWDRIASGWLQGDWSHRWRVFRAGEAGRRFGWIADPGSAIPAPALPSDVWAGAAGHRLRLWLHESPALVALALAARSADGSVATGRTPAVVPTPHREVIETVLSRGLPILLWRRDGGDPAELVEWCLRHAHGALDDLPDLVTRLRVGADESDAEELGHHVTLLWDDYDCLPHHVLAPFQRPEEAFG